MAPTRVLGIRFTADERAQIDALAARGNLTAAKFVHNLVLHQIAGAPTTKAERSAVPGNLRMENGKTSGTPMPTRRPPRATKRSPAIGRTDVTTHFKGGKK